MLNIRYLVDLVLSLRVEAYLGFRNEWTFTIGLSLRGKAWLKFGLYCPTPDYIDDLPLSISSNYYYWVETSMSYY